MDQVLWGGDSAKATCFGDVQYRTFGSCIPSLSNLHIQQVVAVWQINNTDVQSSSLKECFWNQLAAQMAFVLLGRALYYTQRSQVLGESTHPYAHPLCCGKFHSCLLVPIDLLISI